MNILVTTEYMIANSCNGNGFYSHQVEIVRLIKIHLVSPISPRISHVMDDSGYIMDLRSMVFLVPSQRSFKLILYSCNKVL